MLALAMAKLLLVGKSTNGHRIKWSLLGDILPPIHSFLQKLTFFCSSQSGPSSCSAPSAALFAAHGSFAAAAAGAALFAVSAGPCPNGTSHLLAHQHGFVFATFPIPNSIQMIFCPVIHFILGEQVCSPHNWQPFPFLWGSTELIRELALLLDWKEKMV
jgi:hypothetical protein